MANTNKKIVQPKDLPKRGTHSQVVAVAGGTLVFIAGMTSRSEKDAAPVHAGDMGAQVRQIYIVKTTIFTTDVEEFRKANEIRYEY
ncbi:MAG TPA: RidA family protein, partial [Candidatus Binatia bacterium]|nr:RidA family protein [Candidatus Binatia bacterium]